MAFAARLGPLTEELVESLFAARGRDDAAAIKAARDAALHKLKSHTLLRTNQFEVEKALNGLEERFRINCRDSLADALRQRLDGLLAVPSKWHPDILHLLLELSDQPTTKSKLSDLEALRPKSPETEAPLRWEDIAEEDGWGQDTDLWTTIRYSDDSDDEVYTQPASDKSSMTSETPEDPIGDVIERLVAHPEDAPLLDSIRQGQAWRAAAPSDGSAPSRKTAVTELQVIREILFLLQGFPTTMFSKDNQSPLPRFQTVNLTWEAHKAIFHSFAETARQLRVLRNFVRKQQSEASMQAFQGSLYKHLEEFDSQVGAIETRLAQPACQVAITLISVKVEVDPWVERLGALARVVASLEENDACLEPFRYLELLFDEASMAQSAGQTATFGFLARTFLDCFGTFLRPIRYWMDEGRLMPGDAIFFVCETEQSVPLSEIWKHRYILRKNASGHLHAPHFLRPSAQKVFVAGKNIVILQQLGQHDALRRQRQDIEPSLSYETVCPPGSEFAPFPDLFEAAFERWIQSKYRKTSQILKSVLFQSYHLTPALDALQGIFLMSDGSAATYLCDHLFDRLEAPGTSWQDRYVLTVFGQEAFADLCDTSRLSIAIGDKGPAISALNSHSSTIMKLASVVVTYRLPWPVQTVITPVSLQHYQSMFTFLLQIQKALHVLRKIRILDRSQSGEEGVCEEPSFYWLRTNLLWFCSSIQTYLTTLVLAPNTKAMRHALDEAEDIDAMIMIHDTTMKLIIDEGLLGERLAPIRECILDMLDLSLKLGLAHDASKTRRPELPEESDKELDGSDLEEEQEKRDAVSMPPPAALVFEGLKSAFGRHLRFVCEGLRSVARASSNAPSAKWDLLADMLQTGIREKRW